MMQSNQKRTGVATLIPDKTNFKIRLLLENKQECFKMIKGSIPYKYACT